MASSRFWRRKKGDDERLSPPGDAGDNADRTEDLEEEDNRGEEVNGEGGEVTGPDGDGAPSSFFDMSAEEAARYVPPGTVVARKEPFDPKPILLCFLAALVVAGVAAAVVLLWPSSHTSVPDLTGVRLAEAMKEARSRGFEPEVTGWEFSGEHEDGVVIKQRPGADERVEKGGALTLTVSKGPEPGHDSSSVNAPATTVVDGEEGRESSHPFMGKTVCVDPGHQANTGENEWVDPGMTRMSRMEVSARGAATGNAEHLVTLDIGAKLGGLLEKDGINVVMTRESDDVELNNISRAEIANRAEADLYVRVHCGNSSDQAENGTATLYPAKTEWTEGIYEQSKTAALFVQEEMVRSCSTRDLGVSGRDDLAGFNWSKVPAIEVEVAFLSNPDEDALMSTDDFRWKITWGLRNGIIKYFTEG